MNTESFQQSPNFTPESFSPMCLLRISASNTACRRHHLCKTTMAWLVTLTVSIAMIAGGPLPVTAAQTTDNSITLTNGERQRYDAIAGSPSGVALVSQNNSSTFTWTQIQPDTLPSAIRKQHRDAVASVLKEASMAYIEEDYIKALDLYAKVNGHTDYLLPTDMDEPWAENLNRKVNGLLPLNGKWLNREQLLIKKGNIQVNGKWMSPEDQSKQKDRNASVIEAISTLFSTFAEPDVGDYVTQVRRIESLFNEFVRDGNTNDQKAPDVEAIKKIKQYLVLSVIHLEYAVKLYGSTQQYHELSVRALNSSQGRLSRSAERDAQSSKTDAETHVEDARNNYRCAYDLYTRNAQILGVKINPPALSAQPNKAISAENNQESTRQNITSIKAIETDGYGYVRKKVIVAGKIDVASLTECLLDETKYDFLAFTIDDETARARVGCKRNFGADLRQQILQAGNPLKGIFTIMIATTSPWVIGELLKYEPASDAGNKPSQSAQTPAQSEETVPAKVTTEKANIRQRPHATSSTTDSPPSSSPVSPVPQAGVPTSDTPSPVSTAIPEEWKLGSDIQKKVLDLGGGVTLPVVWIPSGEFDMGDKIEEPVHHVRITKGFWMGQYEVTQEQWQRIMGSNPSYYAGAKNPVEQVSWVDCQEFIRRMNEQVGTDCLVLKDGIKSTRPYFFRLPTEAEWEFACRAGTKTRFYTGNEVAGIKEAAWHGYNSGGKSHPVGQKKPNSWGLFDMHGNVKEWCQDWYGQYESDALADPIGPQGGKCRVCRGGSFYMVEEFCCSAERFGVAAPLTSDDSTGFRVVIVR